MKQENINIAELLKDCPKGMELDCTVYNDVTFLRIDEVQNRCYFKAGPADTFWTTCEGRINGSHFAKCVIFPKGKTTWEGFVPHCKFKDGDIVSTIGGSWIGIVKKSRGCTCETYITVHNETTVYMDNVFHFERLATEDEKQKLFEAIKENGYKWNPETKTLEKLIEPKFKVGDVIINIYRKHLNCDSKGGKISQIIDDKYIFDNGSYTHIQFQDNYELVSNKLVEPKFKVGDRVTNGKISITIGYLTDNEYYDEIGRNISNMLSIKNQDDWKLVPRKFDINTLIPFESRVLVRDCNSYKWEGQIFIRYNNKSFNNYNFGTIGGQSWKQCIPYNDDTKHLLGTTDDCDEYYKTWE